MLGELAQTTAGTWIAHPPTRCPNGHSLGPGEVLVGEIGVEGGGDGGDVAGAGGENVGIGRGRVVLLGEVSGTDGGDSVVDDDGFLVVDRIIGRPFDVDAGGVKRVVGRLVGVETVECGSRITLTSTPRRCASASAVTASSSACSYVVIRTELTAERIRSMIG